MCTPWPWEIIICNLVEVSLEPRWLNQLIPTGLAISTAILDMWMNDLLKYLTALSASSGDLKPTYPIRRFWISLTSVMGANLPKCSLKSFSVNLLGGRFLMNIREGLGAPVSSIVSSSVENGEAHMPLMVSGAYPEDEIDFSLKLWSQDFTLPRPHWCAKSLYQPNPR